MANALYGKGRASFLASDFDMLADVISVILADAADYSAFSIDVDDFMDDIPTAGQVPGFASGPALASKTGTLGVFDAADATLSSLSGDQSEYIIIFEDSGVDTTSSLIVNIDTATGIPVTPNGGDITIQWDSGANKIFKL